MRHILLAEDNADDVFLVQRALEEYQMEHELHTVSDGEKALEFIGQVGEAGGIPGLDLVLLDLNLPKPMADKCLGD